MWSKAGAHQPGERGERPATTVDVRGEEAARPAMCKTESDAWVEERLSSEAGRLAGWGSPERVVGEIGLSEGARGGGSGSESQRARRAGSG